MKDQPPKDVDLCLSSNELPTSGKEAEFVEDISKLRIFLEDLLIKDPELLIFIRGDSNVNSKHI